MDAGSFAARIGFDPDSDAAQVRRRIGGVIGEHDGVGYAYAP